MSFLTQIQQHRTRAVVYFVHSFCTVGCGVNFAILGPALLDLQLQTGASSSAIAFLLSARAIGVVGGAISSELNHISIILHSDNKQ